jgi:hypothetical protein
MKAGSAFFLTTSLVIGLFIALGALGVECYHLWMEVRALRAANAEQAAQSGALDQDLAGCRVQTTELNAQLLQRQEELETKSAEAAQYQANLEKASEQVASLEQAVQNEQAGKNFAIAEWGRMRSALIAYQSAGNLAVKDVSQTSPNNSSAAAHVDLLGWLGAWEGLPGDTSSEEGSLLRLGALLASSLLLYLTGRLLQSAGLIGRGRHTRKEDRPEDKPGVVWVRMTIQEARRYAHQHRSESKKTNR